MRRPASDGCSLPGNGSTRRRPVACGYECKYCGKALTSTSGTVDHVVPVSRGGGHVWRNVVAACAKCNNRKADRTLAEAGLRLRREPAVPTRTMLVVTRIEVEKRETWKRWVAG